MFTGSIVALVTPFEKKGQNIDFSAVKKFLELQILEGSDGVVIGGTTGEGPTLEQDEFSELLEFSIKFVNGRIPVIAGTGTNSTKKTVEMTLLAKNLGANGALVITPYYNKPTDLGVLAHYREVSKVGLPFIAYHHPGRCGIELDVLTLIELSKYEFFAGLKECSKNRSAMRELIEKSPGITILSGDDDRAIDMIQMGAKGSVSVIGNLFPAYWKKLILAALNLDFDQAAQLYSQIKPLIWALSLEVNPQCIKCALAKEFNCEEILRLPLLPVIEDTREEIYEALEKFQLETSFQ